MCCVEKQAYLTAADQTRGRDEARRCVCGGLKPEGSEHLYAAVTDERRVSSFLAYAESVVFLQAIEIA